MAGLVLYLLMMFGGAYLLLALLPGGRMTWGLIGSFLLAGLLGLHWGIDPLPGVVSDLIDRPELVLFGAAALVAGVVQGIRKLVPSMRVIGSYGLLVLVAPVAMIYLLRTLEAIADAIIGPLFDNGP